MIFNLTPSPAQSEAISLFGQADAALTAMINTHKRAYSEFWANDQTTPDDILAAMGTDAKKWVTLAAQSVANIAAVATISGLQLNDVLPPEFYVPRRNFIEHDDGTVTLEAAQ